MLRAERTARLKQKPDEELAQLGDDRMHEALTGALSTSIAAAKVADEFPDLATISDAELDQVITQLEADENDLSYRRQTAAREDRHPPLPARKGSISGAAGRRSSRGSSALLREQRLG